MRTVVRVLIALAAAGLVFAGTFVALRERSGSGPGATSSTRPETASTRPATTTVPPTTVPPTTTTTALPWLPLPLNPTPSRIAWTGDSVAESLASEVAAEANARGIEVVNRTISGCGMVRGFPADDQLVPISFVRACDGGVPPNNVATGGSGADVVTWLSTWETANRVVDGQGYVFGTPEGDAKLLELIDESAQQLMAGGARLVFLTMPPNTTGPNRPVVTDVEAQRALHLNDLFRQYAAAHADRVSVLDFASIVCPGGPPCPTEVEGVTLRPVDGGHFAGDGPAWVVPRLLNALVGG